MAKIMKYDFTNLKLGFIGAGNIARAIVNGIVSHGLVKAENIIASAPSMNNLCKFQELGCKTTHNNRDVLNCEVIILCVKPFKVAAVIPCLENYWTDDHTVISVISGVKIHSFYSEYFIPPKVKIVRVMPNLPMSVQAGVTAYCLSDKGSDLCRSIVQGIFSGIGLCEEVTENLIDTVCGLCGSGPAYVFTVIQAMSDGGVKMGLPREQSTRMAAQTVMGAAKMVLQTGKHPDVLRDEVCSPSGTTICGVHVLEKAAVRSAFIGAIEAATERAREQGRTDG